MSVPSVNHPNWAQAIMNSQNYPFEFLATRILVGRLSMKYKQDAGALPACVKELYDFFCANEKQPKAVADMNKIF